MTNGWTVFPPLGQSIPVVLNSPPVKANCSLHSADKGMEKKAFAMSVVAPLRCLGLQLRLELQHVWHSSTQWRCDFIQATIVHCQSPFSIGFMNRPNGAVEGEDHFYRKISKVEIG
ncbi:hypothetical protein BTVI_123205 [Pitangus sulphuratus]|nr:hypothetical protein BTVI_123205 [Pitangus sulphuratus]